MPAYSQERKASIMEKLLPPHNRPVPEIATLEGIHQATLYNWLKQAKQQGLDVPTTKPNNTQHPSPQSKLSTIIETAHLTQSELSEYCRSKGLYPEQITQWKSELLANAQASDKDKDQALKQAQKHIRQLEKELNRKDKALAESAALLVLQKKFQALWADEES